MSRATTSKCMACPLTYKATLARVTDIYCLIVSMDARGSSVANAPAASEPKMTCAALARELEVATRTILRDVDALTEAGLPIIVLQGNRGGIELGFNYRTRLTGRPSTRRKPWR